MSTYEDLHVRFAGEHLRIGVHPSGHLEVEASGADFGDVLYTLASNNAGGQLALDNLDVLLKRLQRCSATGPAAEANLILQRLNTLKGLEDAAKQKQKADVLGNDD